MAAPLITVVNDDPGFVEMMSEVLSDEGYRTSTSLVAANALSDIQHDRPNLIILDIHMQHTRAGWDLLKSIQRDPITAGIPIILSSGDKTLLDAKAEELAADSVDVLEKPFHIKALVERVARLVGHPDNAM